MPKAKATCPKCGNPSASPNARGPNTIYCRRCGGFVDVSGRDDIDESVISTKPALNSELRERGVADHGVVMPDRPTKLRGGL